MKIVLIIGTKPRRNGPLVKKNAILLSYNSLVGKQVAAMLKTIRSIDELNLPNLENARVMLLLNAQKEDYAHLYSLASSIEYPELVICIPENGKDLEEVKNQILQQINRRCRKTPVISTDSIVVFRIIDGKANFHPKRVICSASALEYKAVNTLDELVNLVSFYAAQSFEDLDKAFKKYIDDGKLDVTLGLGIQYSFTAAQVVGVTPTLQVKSERKGILARIITK